MLLKPIIKLLITSAIFTYVGGVLAVEGTPATFSVTSTVTSNCTISATAMAFGNYDPIGINALTDLTQTSTVSITCTKGVNSATVGMDYGQHVTGTTQRQMIGAVATDLLSYNLFQPPGFGGACPGTVAFNNTTPMAIPISTSKTARSFNVCGTVPKDQDATIGTYTDTVTVSINF